MKSNIFKNSQCLPVGRKLNRRKAIPIFGMSFQQHHLLLLEFPQCRRASGTAASTKDVSSWPHLDCSYRHRKGGEGASRAFHKPTSRFQSGLWNDGACAGLVNDGGANDMKFIGKERNLIFFFKSYSFIFYHNVENDNTKWMKRRAKCSRQHLQPRKKRSLKKESTQKLFKSYLKFKLNLDSLQLHNYCNCHYLFPVSTIWNWRRSANFKDELWTFKIFKCVFINHEAVSVVQLLLSFCFLMMWMGKQ